MLVTSSYVRVPPMETLPVKDAPPVTDNVEPSNVKFASPFSVLAFESPVMTLLSALLLIVKLAAP